MFNVIIYLEKMACMPYEISMILESCFHHLWIQLLLNDYHFFKCILSIRFINHFCVLGSQGPGNPWSLWCIDRGSMKKNVYRLWHFNNVHLGPCPNSLWIPVLDQWNRYFFLCKIINMVNQLEQLLWRLTFQCILCIADNADVFKINEYKWTKNTP